MLSFRRVSGPAGVLVPILGLVAMCACSSPASKSANSGATGPDVAGPGFDISGGFVFDSVPLVDVGKDTGLGGSDLGDAAPAPGSFGAPCQDNSECTFPYCVETASGKVCSRECTDSCPAAWKCATVQGASADIISLCIPAFARLCDPCASAADCNLPGASGNLCIAKGPLGSFCGAQCQPDVAGTCPKGYDCESLVDPATGKANWQCVGTATTCACSPVAAQKALQTACSSKNGLGSCAGVRSCQSGTLSDCSAPVPTEEVCNGLDDDCNGQTDDVSGQPECAAKNEFGVCKGKVTGCQDGKPLCTAKVPAPETCNGLDDDCDGATDEALCEDGNGCTEGKCNPDGSCQQLPLSGLACDDGSVCTAKDACLQGKCQGSASLGCDDGNPCTLDGCDPVSGCTHANQDGPCGDDGNACTLDQCAAGTCDHVAMPSGSTCTDDGNPCTQDLCTAKTCGHPVSAVGSPCPEDGDGCTTDTCDGKGACGHGIKGGFCEIQGACIQAGTTQPGNACMVCKPDVNPGAWTMGEGLACDDGDGCTSGDVCGGGVCKGKAKDCSAQSSVCTVGTCDKASGQCVGTAKAGACNDGDSCTSGDACQQGVCKGKVLDCSGLGNACNQAVCQGGQCVTQPKAGSCDDGNPCTINDICSSGTCAGKALDCSAFGSDCNTGTCQNGSCVAIAKPTSTGCNDQDACTSADHCLAGKCTGTLVNCSALGDACNDGVCAAGACVKKAKANSCDDGNPCTINDSCAGGGCAGTPKDCSGSGDACNDGVCSGGGCTKKPKVNGVSCTDGNACTVGDVCSFGSCLGSAMNCNASGDACNDGVCSGGTCGKKAKGDGTFCSDGDACTGSDACTAGKCAGKAIDCSAVADGCNDGVCAAGACQKKQKASGTTCSDGDACTLNDACQSGACKGSAKDCSASGDACNDGVCSGGVCGKKAKANGISCNDGSTCTGSDACSGGTCVGVAIKDLFEPNDVQPGKAVQDKSDCDDASTLTASVSPQADVDWFHYDASDNAFCTVKPSVQLSNLAADYDVCLFFQCHGGAVDSGTVSCDAGTKTAGGPNGSWGCCSSNASTASEFAKISPSCSFLGSGDDGGTVWVRVQGKSSAAMCGGYTLAWSAKN